MSELTVIETGEVVEQMTKVEAERITARIADKLDAIADNLEQVLPLIGEALTRRAWEALNYPSPGPYIEERFGKALDRLPVPVRRPVVGELSAAGMSTRDIAPLVGKSQSTIRDDLQVSGNYSPASPASPDNPDEPEPSSFPVSDKIIGRDGKTYTRPEPRETGEHPVSPKPKRKPLTDSFWTEVITLTRAARRLSEMTADDRYPATKKQLADESIDELLRANDDLTVVINSLTT